jgi:hypothetical protein
MVKSETDTSTVSEENTKGEEEGAKEKGEEEEGPFRETEVRETHPLSDVMREWEIVVDGGVHSKEQKERERTEEGVEGEGEE